MILFKIPENHFQYKVNFWEMRMPPAAKKVLHQRLTLMGIDDDVVGSLKYAAPFIAECMDDIIERFYAYFHSFPAGRKAFEYPKLVRHLKVMQKKHWCEMFRGNLGEQFQRSAYHIGVGHSKKGIAPHLYISGYNFFQCELTRHLSEKFRNDPKLADILVAVTRVISLDMDLALSVYMREIWRNQSV